MGKKDISLFCLLTRYLFPRQQTLYPSIVLVGDDASTRNSLTILDQGPCDYAIKPPPPLVYDCGLSKRQLQLPLSTHSLSSWNWGINQAWASPGPGAQKAVLVRLTSNHNGNHYMNVHLCIQTPKKKRLRPLKWCGVVGKRGYCETLAASLQDRM